MIDELTATDIDCSTGEVTKRLLTTEEIQNHENVKNEWLIMEAEEKILNEIKASAMAKLAALGLTEEEANAIIK